MGALAYNQMNAKMRELLDIQAQQIYDNTPLGRRMKDEMLAKDKALEEKDRIIEAERLEKERAIEESQRSVKEVQLLQNKIKELELKVKR
jgi:hypothetical protein